MLNLFGVKLTRKNQKVVELYALKGNRDNKAPISGGVIVDATDTFDQMGKPCCFYANEWSRS